MTPDMDFSVRKESHKITHILRYIYIILLPLSEKISQIKLLV